MSENERQSQSNAVINDKLQGTVVTFIRVLPTRWRQKSTGIDMEQNYVSVTLSFLPVIVVVYVATSSVTKININRVTAMSLLQHCVYHAMVTFHGGSFMSREHTRGCRKRKKRTPSLQLRAVHTYAARRCTALVKTHSLCFHERSNAQRSVCVNTTAKMHRVTISRTPTRGVPTRPYV